MIDGLHRVSSWHRRGARDCFKPGRIIRIPKTGPILFRLGGLNLTSEFNGQKFIAKLKAMKCIREQRIIAVMASPIVLPKRPILTLPFLLPFCSESTVLIAQRNQSTYRRLKQRLRVKPDASFGSSPQESDHIIYNPPSSAPSVYRTPTKFLPPNDVRRKLRADSDPDISNSTNELPRVFKAASASKHYLTAKDIEEMRQLRLKDPMTWSRGKLAKRFNCNPLFVGMVCEASPEKKAVQKQVLEAVKSRWGIKRTMAREDRELRKEVWARDR